ncbi:MAG: hypothetical protein IPH13_20115 [Planctomycetes bacterium]|nr:hypothetical protein [Planctomycetota bacterium]
MNLKIKNATKYRTADLRRFFEAGLRAYGAQRDRTIEVEYSRRAGYVSGCASIGGTWIKLRLPRQHVQGSGLVPYDTIPERQMRHVAFVFAHELQHNLGHRHSGGSAHGGTLTHGEYDDVGSWWVDLTIRQTPPKPTVPREVCTQRLVEKRERRAREALDRALSDLKRVQNRVRKWQRKVAYYDRKLALAAGTSS